MPSYLSRISWLVVSMVKPKCSHKRISSSGLVMAIPVGGRIDIGYSKLEGGV